MAQLDIFSQVPSDTGDPAGSVPPGNGADDSGHGLSSAPSFDPKRAARRTDPVTSHLAAQSLVGKADGLRARVLQVHYLYPFGLTDDELWQHLPGQMIGSLAKRRGELADMGLLGVTDQRRLTRRDRLADVYRITPAGRVAHQALTRTGEPS